MSLRLHPLRRFAQSGFTIVELMVSVVIALILMIALMQLLLGTMQTDRSSSDLSRMQESGRNALETMGRALRQAGARINADVPFSGPPLTGTSSAPDTITVQYEAQAGGEPDCAGNTVAAGALVTYAFAVNTAVNPPTLTCNGNVLASNVEDLRISYGIDTGKDGTIDSYTTTPTATQFAQVAAVQVSLLVRGAATGSAANRSQTYTFNGASVTNIDGFLRQVYNATFTVRNQAG